MQVFDSVDSISGLEQGTAISLGNFDGIHLGHRDIFRTLVRRSRELNVKSVVCTFEPHPLKILAPDRAPLLLNTADEKVRLIEASNVDILANIPFSKELAFCEAEDFVRDLLVEKLHVKAIVVGYDYAFGRHRKGTGAFLSVQGAKYGFSVDVLRPLGTDGIPYSSSRVRELLIDGRVEEIPSLLGRHYTLAGKVVDGEKRGRTIGFPTANIITEKEQLPASGIYAVIVRLDNTEYQGLVNLGRRPTFGPGEEKIEVYLLDFKGDLYGKELRLYFVARLREEKTFDDAASLITAINQDVVDGRRLLSGVKIIQYKEYLAD